MALSWRFLFGNGVTRMKTRTDDLSEKRRSGGRPRKFSSPSRVITVTLPEYTLSQLNTVDTDRAQAIVKVTDEAMKEAWPGKERVKRISIGPGISMIVVGPNDSLKKISWLRLVEIAPARFLLAIPTGTATEKLEVAISDLMEDVQPGDEAERGLLEELRSLIGHLRKQNKMSKSEIILVGD